MNVAIRPRKTTSGQELPGAAQALFDKLERGPLDAPKEEVLLMVRGALRKKAERALEQLLESPDIRCVLDGDVALKSALLAAIEKGTVSERDGMADAMHYIQKAKAGKEIGLLMLDTRKTTKVGRPPRGIEDMRKKLRELVGANHEARRFAEEPSFRVYLDKMALALYANGITAEMMGAGTAYADAVMEHVATEYELLSGILAKGMLKTHGHKNSVFYVDGLYREADVLFVGKYAKLRKTAVSLVLKKQYSSLKAVNDKLAVLNADPELQKIDAKLRKTAVYLVLTKAYPSLKAVNDALKEGTLEIKEED